MEVECPTSVEPEIMVSNFFSRVAASAVACLREQPANRNTASKRGDRRIIVFSTIMTTSRMIVFVAALSLAACAKKPEKVVVPEVYRVNFETSQGNFVVEVTRAWAPRGADRFHELVGVGYFNEGRFFRVVSGLIAKFGVHRKYE